MSIPTLGKAFRMSCDWISGTSQHHHLAALALWTDAAKDALFDHTSSPLYLEKMGWVIRKHEMKITDQAYKIHAANDYRTPLMITSQVQSIGRTSLVINHNIAKAPESVSASQTALCTEMVPASEQDLIASVRSVVVAIDTEGYSKPLPDAVRNLSKFIVPTEQRKPVTDNETSQEETSLPVTELRSRFSDLDGFMHVNNAATVRFFCDALFHTSSHKTPEDYTHRSQAVSSMEINYIQPIFAHENIEIHSKATADGKHTMEMIRQPANETVATSTVNFHSSEEMPSLEW